MNGLTGALAEARAIFATATDHPGVDIAICPPFTLIGPMVAAAPGGAVGGQDCHSAEAGAFTGSVAAPMLRSEEHTSELQSLMRISYAVFCLKKKTKP